MQVYRLFLPSSPTGVTTPLFLASKLEPIREAGLSSFISSELNYLTSRGRGWFVQVCFRALLRGRFGEMNFFPPRPLAPFLPIRGGFSLCLFSICAFHSLQGSPCKTGHPNPTRKQTYAAEKLPGTRGGSCVANTKPHKKHKTPQGWVFSTLCFPSR